MTSSTLTKHSVIAAAEEVEQRLDALLDARLAMGKAIDDLWASVEDTHELSTPATCDLVQRCEWLLAEIGRPSSKVSADGAIRLDDKELACMKRDVAELPKLAAFFLENCGAAIPTVAGG